MIVVIPAVLLIACLAVFVYLQSRGFRSVSCTLTTDKISCDRLKIALLTDLHNHDYGNGNEPLLNAIDAFAPDIVCFSGDMVTSGWDVSFDFSKTVRFIEQIAAKYPVYYGFGNHEQAFNEDRKKFPHEFDDLKSAMDKAGVPLLDNERVVLPQYNVEICGLNLEYAFYRKVRPKHLDPGLLPELLGDPDPSRYTILLAHNPDHFPAYARWGADLVLSGHVHGGIINLPGIGGLVSPGIRFFPKYDAGIFTEGSSTMYLSRGIGSHSIPIRINNKAEIVCLTIQKGSKDES